MVYSTENNKEIANVTKMVQIKGTTNVRLCINNKTTKQIEFYDSVAFVGVPAHYIVDINATIDIYSDINSEATSLNI